MSADTDVAALRRDGRIVVMGASLAGLRAAETLREQGFTGSLTMIGDEPYEPYDRPPLSKQVLLGRARAEDTQLPRRRDVNAQWRLAGQGRQAGTPGERRHRRLRPFTDRHRNQGARGSTLNRRSWTGVFVLRTRDDSARLKRKLTSGSARVLVIGAGFTGCEVASACRELNLDVTVAERGPAPLVGALGGVIGAVADRMQRRNGVDLRCGVSVTALEGDDSGRLRRAHLSDGTAIDVQVAVVSLGALRTPNGWPVRGWPRDLGASPATLDAGCSMSTASSRTTSCEHWGNAVEQAEIAAHITCSSPADII
ncbi:NAD(P)/FAD-dependent oxidoreductase [Streptomyces sp. NPDC001835]|uniref:NAD(P)/FAD-dependent oxidoreductase n=1 Tax=Streptomyces sp. NPDC001835 TaxID=3154528 RepID=UPI0033240182